MTVAQLIEALQALPSEAHVIVSHELEGMASGLCASSIRTCKVGDEFSQRFVSEHGWAADDTVVVLEM